MINRFLEDKQPRYIEYLASLYYLGSFFFLGRIYPLERMSWIMIPVAAVATLPFLYGYYRLIMKYKVTNFQLILALALAIFSGVMLTYCFAEFIKTCVLPDMPQWLVPAGILVLCLWMALKDIHVLERFSRLTGPVVLFLLLLSIGSGLSKVEFSYTHGYFNFHGFFSFSDEGAWLSIGVLFTIYLVEGYLLTTLLAIRKKTPAIFKETAKGLLVSAACLAAIYLTTVMALGPQIFELLTYPIYYPPGLTQTAEYLERIEVLLLAVFTFSIFIKLSVFMMIGKEVSLHVRSKDKPAKTEQITV